MIASGGYLRGVRLERASVPTFDEYPFSIPAIRSLDEYRTSLERRWVPTKRLDPAAKHEYLLRHLGRA